MFLPVFVCFLSVCLLARLLKNACMDLDEMLRVDRCLDMDELITFEPDPDHSPDAGTVLLSPISCRLRNFAALPRLPASCAATRNFYVGKIPRIRSGGTPLTRAVVLKCFIH